MPVSSRDGDGRNRKLPCVVYGVLTREVFFFLQQQQQHHFAHRPFFLFPFFSFSSTRVEMPVAGVHVMPALNRWQNG